MNIFYVDHDPVKCAEYHVDRHVVKMIVEYAQLMSTAHRILDNNDNVYQATHVNHPSTIWTRKTTSNYEWLFQLWTCLLDEYAYRYGRKHATSKLYPILFNAPRNIAQGEFTQPTPAMPDEYKVLNDSIASYRAFYTHAKKHLLSWKKRNPPQWIIKDMQWD